MVVEDSADDYELLLRELRKGAYAVTSERVVSADQLDAALDVAPTERWDLVISDWSMPGFSGRAVLETIAARRVNIPCIVVSGTPGEEAAVQALRLGALDFLSKDKPRRLVPAVQRALREAADHAARIAAEQELQLSEDRYRTGFEVAPEALVTIDLEARRTIDANGKALRLFRRTLEEIRASDPGEFSAPIQADGRPVGPLLDELFERAASGEPVTWNWRLLVDGEIIPVELQAVHLPTKIGKLVRIGIIDLRERLRVEEIRRRAVELEQQNRRIQEASRLKSEFLANMSHELRTPLNAIIGFAELLYDGQVPASSPQHREFLGDILASGRHLLQLINDVLDLAKVEAGKLEFRPEPVDVTRLLSEVTAIVRTLAAQKRLRVEVEVDRAGLGTIVIDAGRMKQIIYNYLSNALKFTPPNGRVTVRVRPEDAQWFRLEVEDTGVGIAEADLGRLFVEFEQLEAGSAKRHQGTGLGLALTKRLVEAQGGTVGVRSKVGSGTTFHAILPRRALSEQPVLPRTITREGARVVLVVEDDSADQHQLVSTLSSAGYSVELAATGKEAIAQLRRRKFDAVTLDLLLPDMSGLDLLGALGEVKSAAETPIIVVTVVPDLSVLKGFPIHEILPKPVSRDRLLGSLMRAGLTGPKLEKA